MNNLDFVVFDIKYNKIRCFDRFNKLFFYIFCLGAF